VNFLEKLSISIDSKSRRGARLGTRLEV